MAVLLHKIQDVLNPHHFFEMLPRKITCWILNLFHVPNFPNAMVHSRVADSINQSFDAVLTLLLDYVLLGLLLSFKVQDIIESQKRMKSSAASRHQAKSFIFFLVGSCTSIVAIKCTRQRNSQLFYCFDLPSWNSMEGRSPTTTAELTVRVTPAWS